MHDSLAFPPLDLPSSAAVAYRRGRWTSLQRPSEAPGVSDVLSDACVQATVLAAFALDYRWPRPWTASTWPGARPAGPALTDYGLMRPHESAATALARSR